MHGVQMMQDSEQEDSFGRFSQKNSIVSSRYYCFNMYIASSLSFISSLAIGILALSKFRCACAAWCLLLRTITALATDCTVLILTFKADFC